MRALVIGGTEAAVEVAGLLVGCGWQVTTSLRKPIPGLSMPAGAVRLGGFDSPAALAGWLIREGIEVIVDAAHPFAELDHLAASEAARATGIPCVTVEPPSPAPTQQDRWTWCKDVQEAARIAAQQFHHVLVVLGGDSLAPFALDAHNLYVLRSSSPPRPPYPARYRWQSGDGMYSVEAEKKHLIGHQIDAIVTREDASKTTSVLLEAARQRGVDVLLIKRPPLPETSAVAASPSAAVELVATL